jgi:hypothetical protein
MTKEFSQNSIASKILKLRALLDSGRSNEAAILLDSITKKNEESDIQFKYVMYLLDLEDKPLLWGYYHGHPAYEEGENDASLRAAIFKSLNNLNDGVLQNLKNILLDYVGNPDIFSIWKFALVGHIVSIWAADTGSDIESELPTFNRLASSLIEDDWNNSIDLFKAITVLYESKERADFSEYSDYLKSLFYCGISASTAYAENIAEDGVRMWLWGIGSNRNSENRLEEFGISNKAPWGCGEMMQEARRFAEEVLEENFEVPDGTNYEEDAYLDNYDWDILAQTIIDD